MTGKRETWNWPLSRQDANPSSWTILAYVYSMPHSEPSSPYRIVPPSQEKGYLEILKSTSLEIGLKPSEHEQQHQARDIIMSKWRCFIHISFLLTVLLELIYQVLLGPPHQAQRLVLG